MNAKLAALTALPFLFSAAADAQSLDLAGVPGMAYRSSTSRETWRTVMLVSGVFLVAGLASDDSTLILLGGAGLLVSLAQTNGNYYSSVGRNMEFAKFGRVSMGVSPFSPMKLSQGMANPHPGFVVQAKFKF